MKPVHLGDVGANRVERQPNHPRNRLLAVECSSLLLGDLHQPIDLVEAADYQAFFATNARMRQEHRATYERGVAEGRLPTKERGLMVRGMREWREDGPARRTIRPRVAPERRGQPLTGRARTKH